MPRRRWQVKNRRVPLNPALRTRLEHGLGGLQALAKGDRPAGYAEAYWFTPASARAAAWAEHGEQILAEWILARPGSRPVAWWQYEAPAPRRCLEGAQYVWPAERGAWIWKQESGLPGRPQARQPGAKPERLVFESQAVYLRRLGLLAAGEAERIPAAALEPEVLPLPELPPEMELHRALPTLERETLVFPASVPVPPSTNGASRRVR